MSNRLIILIFVLIFGLSWFEISRLKKDYLTDNPLFKELTLKDGDLIFRKGKSFESFMVLQADNGGEFSHVGIIFFEDGKPKVIHAVPSGNQNISKEPVEVFLQKENCSKFAVYRAKLSLIELDKIKEITYGFYNNHYVFDNNYDLSTDTELYCTELIYKAFSHAGINLMVPYKNLDYIVGNQTVIMPSALTLFPFQKIY